MVGSDMMRITGNEKGHIFPVSLSDSLYTR